MPGVTANGSSNAADRREALVDDSHSSEDVAVDADGTVPYTTVDSLHEAITDMGTYHPYDPSPARWAVPAAVSAASGAVIYFVPKPEFLKAVSTAAYQYGIGFFSAIGTGLSALVKRPAPNLNPDNDERHSHDAAEITEDDATEQQSRCNRYLQHGARSVMPLVAGAAAAATARRIALVAGADAKDADTMAAIVGTGIAGSIATITEAVGNYRLARN
jgi:hypothetical protein